MLPLWFSVGQKLYNGEDVKYTRVADDNIKTLRWLISVRYKVVLTFLGLLLFGSQVYLAPLSSTLSIVSVSVFYLIVNGLYSLLLKANPSPRRVEIIKQIQLPVELV